MINKKINAKNIKSLEIESKNSITGNEEIILILRKKSMSYGIKKENEKYYDPLWMYSNKNDDILLKNDLLKCINDLINLTPLENKESEYSFIINIELIDNSKIEIKRNGTLRDNNLDTICDLITNKIYMKENTPLIFGNK